MKKTLLIALAAVLLYSCSKKNDSSPSSITGKWYVTLDSLAEYTDGTLSSHSTTLPNRTDYATFNTNGSGQSVSTTSGVTSTVNYSYTVSGKILTLSFPTQVVNGETIQAYSEQFTINILNSSKLETQYSTTEIDGGDTFKIFELTDFDR